MRILLIGERGQLGQEIIKSNIFSDYDLITVNSNDLNLEDEKNIKQYIQSINPEIIINAAAYTDVDEAEIKKQKAHCINAAAPKVIADLAKELNIFFIHFSTDYVFGKNSIGPYDTDSITIPLNYYGVTKLEGENNILNSHCNSLIIRVASLFSMYGDNFIKKIISLMQNEDKISVINDQKISLTYAYDVAKHLNKIISYYLSRIEEEKLCKEVIHLTNYGYTTWFEIAEKTKEYILSNNYENINCDIFPIGHEEWQSKAIRPVDSRLKLNKKLFNKMDFSVSNWEDSLFLFIDKYYDGK